MCDYSLHAVATRPAKVAETLVSTCFRGTTTRGFASADDLTVAVCLRPGTEIAFETSAQTSGFIFRRNVRDRLARFRQVDLDKPDRHHDVLEFSNGKLVWVSDLRVGQKATVLQLPVDATRSRKAIAPSARVQQSAL